MGLRRRRKRGRRKGRPSARWQQGQRRSAAGRDHQGEGRCRDAALARRLQGAGQVRLVQCRRLDQEGRRQEEEEVNEEGGGEKEEVVVDCQQYFVIDFRIL